jgi:hypothetical protein
MEHGNLELDCDFLLPSGTHFGLLFQGHYEIPLPRLETTTSSAAFPDTPPL